MLASALDGGVAAVLRRPLDDSAIAACLGGVLRRHASVEFVYKVGGNNGKGGHPVYHSTLNAHHSHVHIIF